MNGISHNMHGHRAGYHAIIEYLLSPGKISSPGLLGNYEWSVQTGDIMRRFISRINVGIYFKAL